MYETAYQRLEESLTDLVAEEQAKLGYRKEEIRLYYPLSDVYKRQGSDSAFRRRRVCQTVF